MPKILINCVLYNNPGSLFAIKLDINDTIGILKAEIRRENPNALRKVDANSLILWQVCIPGDENLARNVRNLDPSKQVPLLAWEKLSFYFEDAPLERHVHIVAIVSTPESEAIIINDLTKQYRELFTALQITVQQRKRWSRLDVKNNNGVFISRQDHIPLALSELEQRLNRLRTYTASENNNHHVRNAQYYGNSFSRIFSLGAEPPRQIFNPKEYAALYNFNLCYKNDVQVIATNPSSAMKASTFIATFIHPSFLSSSSPGPGQFQYTEQMPWKFPIFIMDRGESIWRRFRPSSDFSVISPRFLCPFIICEIVSQEDEEDRYRMLLQGIAITRVGNYLTKSRPEQTFFTVAIYLRANLTAERYIIMPVEPDNSRRSVNILQKNFDLQQEDEAIDFLREIFNLKSELDQLGNQLDPAKVGLLAEIHYKSTGMPSLHSGSPASAPATRSALATIHEGTGSGLQEAFHNDQIYTDLDEMSWVIDEIQHGYPHIATVVKQSNRTLVGYMKFVKDGCHEIEIIQLLHKINSPANHTISPIRVWSVQGGSIMLMPFAGSWLKQLANPSAHLWAVARQLFEAVNFMHEHGVAHMDLKPENILIPIGYGRLTIIDFNGSVRVRDPEQQFEGLVGTKGYTAPEVGCTKYSAVRADLWSCGKVMQEFCIRCEPSSVRTQLLEICNKLLSGQPARRPMMSQVLEWMSDHSTYRQHPVVPTNPLPM